MVDASIEPDSVYRHEEHHQLQEAYKSQLSERDSIIVNLEHELVGARSKLVSVISERDRAAILAQEDAWKARQDAAAAAEAAEESLKAKEVAWEASRAEAAAASEAAVAAAQAELGAAQLECAVLRQELLSWGRAERQRRDAMASTACTAAPEVQHKATQCCGGRSPLRAAAEARDAGAQVCPPPPPPSSDIAIQVVIGGEDDSVLPLPMLKAAQQQLAVETGRLKDLQDQLASLELRGPQLRVDIEGLQSQKAQLEVALSALKEEHLRTLEDLTTLGDKVLRGSAAFACTSS
jgi:peptidoglycan hydrolase CwlO-like protein